MDDVDLGWVAGLLEGEAYFHFAQYRRTRVRKGQTCTYQEQSVWVRVASTDLDVLVRLADVTEIGAISKRKVLSPLSKKPQWFWHVGRRDDLRMLLSTIQPLMSERRKVTIKKMVTYLGPVVYR